MKLTVLSCIIVIIIGIVIGIVGICFKVDSGLFALFYIGLALVIGGIIALIPALLIKKEVQSNVKYDDNAIAICPHCGAKNNNKIPYCTKCGCRLK